MGNRFLKGAMILSISMFATKFLGILYVIPFQQLVGTSGMALYNYAYTPYALFINTWNSRWNCKIRLKI